MFIVFEGIDGAGKSTLMTDVANYLHPSIREVWQTAEPTTGMFGKKAREKIENSPEISLEVDLELQGLFFEDRKRHVAAIERKIKSGFVVLCDRYIWSSIVYCHPENRLFVSKLNEELLRPDLTILLMADPSIAHKRCQKDSLSLKEEDFASRQKRYFDLAEINRSNTLILNNETVEDAKKNLSRVVKWFVHAPRNC